MKPIWIGSNLGTRNDHLLRMLKWPCCRGTPSQNLSGTLSPTIGNLTNLQTV